MKPIYSLILFIPLFLSLYGCGSEGPGGTAASKAVLNSSSAPAGSVPAETTPSPTPTPTPSPTASPVAGASRPLYSYPSIQSYGPADGQTGNPVRLLYLGLHTDLGIDQRMRVRMSYMSSPGRYDATTGLFIGGQSNYNTISATITLLVNGTAIESHEMCDGQLCPSTSPRIWDFSTAVYNATFGRAAATLALRISNVKSDSKYLTGFCNTDFTNCYNYMVNAGYGTSYSQQFCSNNYSRCMNNIYPVAALTEFQGWRFSVDMETDRTIRFP